MAEPVPVSHLRRTLRRQFGFRSLRQGQEEVMRSVLEGRDTLAIMPTGAGKSLCYQLPGLHLEGTTLVVSPLISLMKDQVDKLRELGIEASQVHSSLTSREESAALESIAGEASEFVFTTPERLATPEFLATLRGNTIDLFVVDEAHCISEWGHDFRPAYLELKEAAAALGRPPILALTATATERVVDDVVARLGLSEPVVIDTGVYRENLRLEVIPAPSEREKDEHLVRLLREIDGTGIVYVATVRHCEEVADRLTGLGLPVARYHGRLGRKERHESQDRFMAGEVEAVVATNAFGMGIDKADIRFVIHYDLPGSLESYYQEAGRAGRDGEPARCILLYDPEDRRTQQFFLRGRYPRPEDFAAVYRALVRLGAAGEPAALAAVPEKAGVSRSRARVVLSAMRELGLVAESGEEVRLLETGLKQEDFDEAGRLYREKAATDQERLKRMIHYAQTALCRWKVLLGYFGEELEPERRPADRCGHCDNCARPIPEPVAMPTPRAVAALELLPPVHGERPGAELRPGDLVTLPIYGRGEVAEVGEASLVVAFADGERREFRKS